MRKLCALCMIGVSLFLPLIVNASDASSVHEDHPYQFKVRNNPGHYAFVRHKISSPVKDTYPGDILALGSTLLLYKKPYCKEDAFQATGVVRAEQWILWKDPWAKSIDIFDSDNVKIGMNHQHLDRQRITFILMIARVTQFILEQRS